MPRLLHQPPRYWRHSDSGQAAVTLFGKRIYLGKYGSAQSYERYREAIAKWRRSLGETPSEKDEAESPVLRKITEAGLREKHRQGAFVSVNELIVVYLRHARKYYRKNNEVTREAGCIADVLKLLREHHGKKSAADFGPVDLDSLRDEMITERDWARKYLNKQVGRIVRMFKWAVEKEIVPASTHSALEKLTGLKKGRTEARETEDVTPVEDTVIDKTIPFLPEIVADMVRFQRLTGARPGEVCSISPGDIDRSKDVWIYTVDSHKTEHYEKDRIVAIGPKAQALLTPYLLRPDESFCFSPAESVARARRKQTEARKTPLSSGNRPGTNRIAAPQRVASTKYKVASYSLAIRRACEKSGVIAWNPNRLRHTAATAIRKIYGLEGAQVVCGHANANVTQIYAERDQELATKIARDVG